MRRFSLALHLLSLLIAGFLIPLAQNPPAPESQESTVIAAPQTALLPINRSPQLSRFSPVRTASRSLLSSSENIERLLLVYSNGTANYVNRNSLDSSPWSISMDGNLTEERIYNNANYLSLGEDLSLYEFVKGKDPRKLDLTIEKFVLELAKGNGPANFIGSINMTVKYVDEFTGTELFRYTSSGLGGDSTVDDSALHSALDFSQHSERSVIMIKRIDYGLSASYLGKPLWSLKAARVIAHTGKYEHRLPLGDDNSLELFQVSWNILPVFSVHRTRELVNVGTESHYLPSPVISEVSSLGDTSEIPVLPPLDKCGGLGQGCLLRLPGPNQDGVFAVASIPDNVLQQNEGLPLLEMFHQVSIYQAPADPLISGNSSSSEVIHVGNDSDGVEHVSRKELGMKKNVKIYWAPFLIIAVLAAMVLYMILSNPIKEEQKYSGFKEQGTISRKKKARKSTNTKKLPFISNHDSVSVSKVENDEANALMWPQRDDRHLLVNLSGSEDSSNGRWVGRLFVSNSEIGKGSNGTVVFEGVYDGRKVAVKRLLRAHHGVALKEIQNLIASDRHPNIVRWYGVEQDTDFVYISLERCSCSLGDLIQMCSRPSSDPNLSSFHLPDALDEHKIKLEFLEGIPKDLELWRPNGLPSSNLLKLMRDIVFGLVHLHELCIIHRDLKPQNVLISSGKSISAKLSDMGISKRLPYDMTSLSLHSTGGGSSGWQAPEQILHMRQTRAVDLFSLGCILFFCITKGKHPFGSYFERDSNIINNNVDLFLVDQIPEAFHLLSQLLDKNPEKRPNAVEVLSHPLFWSSDTRMSFLRDTSDRVELEDRENESGFVKALESAALVAFGGRWGEKLDSVFITDLGKYRKYNFELMRDLLRVIRNKFNHFRELPKELQEVLGPVPEGFDGYFSSRFPNLLIEVYKVVNRFCREEKGFKKYFTGSLI